MHFNKFTLEGLEFPMEVNAIPKFENMKNLNINVFELTGIVLKFYINVGMKVTKMYTSYRFKQSP